MEVAGGMLISVILVIIVGVLVQSFIIHLAAKFSGVRYATFGMAIKACLACTVLSFVLSAVFSFIPGPGTILGFLISIVLTLLILKSIYNTTWGRALLIWVMQIVVLILLALVIGSLMGVAVL